MLLHTPFVPTELSGKDDLSMHGHWLSLDDCRSKMSAMQCTFFPFSHFPFLIFSFLLLEWPRTTLSMYLSVPRRSAEVHVTDIRILLRFIRGKDHLTGTRYDVNMFIAIMQAFSCFPRDCTVCYGSAACKCICTHDVANQSQTGFVDFISLLVAGERSTNTSLS